MAIVGLQFSKILVEKHAPVKGKVQVNNNVQLKELEKTDLMVGSAKQGALKLTFEFTAKYEPKFADMIMNGSLTFVDTPDKVNEVLEGWKKNKQLPREVTASVLNTVLSRCNIEAIILAREVNLPSPVPLPKVQVR